jgi:hypothetical protein
MIVIKERCPILPDTLPSLKTVKTYSFLIRMSGFFKILSNYCFLYASLSLKRAILTLSSANFLSS